MLTELVRDRTPYVLLDYPDHPNVGDSMIWIGELAAIRAAGGGAPRYVCTIDNYDPDRVARSLGPDGLIFLHGGGNVGDLWPRHQHFRERVLSDFPRHEIVQLPQSIEFRDASALQRAREAFRHPRFTLLVRTARSLELAQQHFSCTSLLVPDAALAIGPLERHAAPDTPAVYLARTDKEARPSPTSELPAWIKQVDWLDERLSWRGRITRMIASRPRLWSKVARMGAADYEMLAHERMRRGVRLLSRGQIVVTDRLHAHVLCVLLGVRHVILDNSYGKVRAMYDTWTHDAALAEFATDLDDAVERAERMLSAPAGPTS